MASRILQLRTGSHRSILAATFRARPAQTLGPRRAFTNTSSRPSIARRGLFLVPLAGGIALYALPRETSPIDAVLSSPTLIPCRSKPDMIIESPTEPHHTLLARIKNLLRDWIIEPVLTVRRFTFLFIIFMPVIITSPMLLVGSPERRLDGDRWGAVWWYRFLVKQMATAGPTFIKVRYTKLFMYGH
jgi:aarF domain-containing kinase